MQRVKISFFTILFGFINRLFYILITFEFKEPVGKLQLPGSVCFNRHYFNTVYKSFFILVVVEQKSCIFELKCRKTHAAPIITPQKSKSYFVKN